MDPADNSAPCMMTLFEYFCYQAAKSASYQSEPQDFESSPVSNSNWGTGLAHGGPWSVIKSSALDLNTPRKKHPSHRHKASWQLSSLVSRQLSSPTSLQLCASVSPLPSASVSLLDCCLVLQSAHHWSLHCSVLQTFFCPAL